MGERTIWQGRITTRGKLAGAAAMLCAPALLWMLALVVLPGIALVALAFTTRDAQGQVEFTFTSEHVLRAFGWSEGEFAWDNLRILVRTLVAATITSAIAIALAFPCALWIASRPSRWRAPLLALVTVPLCTNIVVRSYAWMLLLGPASLAAKLAAMLGFIESGTSLYPSVFAVYLGMIAASLPFAVLTLYTSVERMDWSLVHAASDLYGSRLRVLYHGLLAQSVPGLAAAFVLTFVPALGMFVIPDLLGGAKYWMVGNLVQQQFGASRNWPYGAALSLILLLLTIPGVLMLVKRRAYEGEPGGGTPVLPLGTRTMTAITALLLYVPLGAVLAASFFSTKTGLTFGAPTLKWYSMLFKDGQLWEYVRNTLVLAGSSTLIATILGTMLAVALERYPWKPKLQTAVNASLQVPVVMPDILFAIGIVIALGALRQVSSLFEPGLFSMVLGHVSFQIAFVTLVVRARLAVLGSRYQEAAFDLYCSRWLLLRRVTLPLLLPGILSGALLAFTLSLDDFVISFMTSAPGSTTLPVHIYASVRRGLSPELHALSAVMLLVTVLLVLAVQRLNRPPTMAA
jgi:spermidine/putrescine transport system permease protein